MAEWFQDLISDYKRQLERTDAPRSMQVTLGPNDITTWEAYDKPWFVAEYRVPILPTSGGVVGSRGQNITYGLPLSVEPVFEMVIHDYDAELRDKLIILAAARTELRIWAWGIFIATGMLAQVDLPSMFDSTLKVSFTLSGLRYFTASAHDKFVTDYDLSSDIHILDMPFSADPTSDTIFNACTILYGNEVI
jgi:hypothetical protein